MQGLLLQYQIYIRFDKNFPFKCKNIENSAALVCVQCCYDNVPQAKLSSNSLQTPFLVW